jgi:hypothetical protein
VSLKRVRDGVAENELPEKRARINEYAKHEHQMEKLKEDLKTVQSNCFATSALLISI